jgi:hypothetical protein
MDGWMDGRTDGPKTVRHDIRPNAVYIKNYMDLHLQINCFRLYASIPISLSNRSHNGIIVLEMRSFLCNIKNMKVVTKHVGVIIWAVKHRID